MDFRSLFRAFFRSLFNAIELPLRTVKPQEKAPPEPFKRRVFSENVTRLKKVLTVAKRFNAFLQSCFSWEKPDRSLTAFLIFQFVVFFFEPFMAPLAVAAAFFAYPVIANNLDEEDSGWLTDPFVEEQGGNSIDSGHFSG